MSLTNTPRANQLHIGIFGRRNSGKSSLINAITNHEVALVSDIAGTTTDPVYKSMEIHGIGPCMFIDTAGFDDEGELGKLRIDKTKKAIDKVDIALMVFNSEDILKESEWLQALESRKIPVIAVLNKADILENTEEISDRIFERCNIRPVAVSAKDKKGTDKIKEEILRLLPGDYEVESITGNLAKPGDTVLLVMPQDIQAPKGRLILPQVQTIRDLLDKKCIVASSTADNLDEALELYINPPDLIITDSQVFKEVYDKKPKSSKLTSFSVLFANYKGDFEYFKESAHAIEKLNENSRVLIAEACTHAPLSEDIGREKIPNMLRKRFGENITIDVVSGTDFIDELSHYDLIIHCGACMFNRKYVMSRIERAKSQRVPMTNYGVTIAYLSGILDKIDIN